MASIGLLPPESELIASFRISDPLPEGVDADFIEKFHQTWEKFRSDSQQGEFPRLPQKGRPRRSNFSRSELSRKEKSTRLKAENLESLDSGTGSFPKGIASSSLNDESSREAQNLKREIRRSNRKGKTPKLLNNGKENDSGFANISSMSSVRQKTGELERVGSSSMKQKASTRNFEDIRAKRRKYLETHETESLWVQCCFEECSKWRLVLEYEDPTEVPEKWYCEMNNDPNFASCDVAEEHIPSDVNQEIIENKYTIGTIVWARVDGYPWWPAIVDTCPDSLRWYQLIGGSNIPTKYHVVFFDSKKRQRAWIADKNLKAYARNPRETVVKKTIFKRVNYKAALNAACELANKAVELSRSDRLEKFGWIGGSFPVGPKVPKTSCGRRNNFPLEGKKNGPGKNKNDGTSEAMEKDAAENRLKIGDIVWTHPKNFPWWPAMIDECSVSGKHYRLPDSPGKPIEYHVVYFYEPKLEIDWWPYRDLKPFSQIPRENFVQRAKKGVKKDYERELVQACSLAKKAQSLSTTERLKRFGLSARMYGNQEESDSGQELPSTSVDDEINYSTSPRDRTSRFAKEIPENTAGSSVGREKSPSSWADRKPLEPSFSQMLFRSTGSSNLSMPSPSPIENFFVKRTTINASDRVSMRKRAKKTRRAAPADSLNSFEFLDAFFLSPPVTKSPEPARSELIHVFSDLEFRTPPSDQSFSSPARNLNKAMSSSQVRNNRGQKMTDKLLDYSDYSEQSDSDESTITIQRIKLRQRHYSPADSERCDAGGRRRNPEVTDDMPMSVASGLSAIDNVDPIDNRGKFSQAPSDVSSSQFHEPHYEIHRVDTSSSSEDRDNDSLVSYNVLKALLGYREL